MRIASFDVSPWGVEPKTNELLARVVECCCAPTLRHSMAIEKRSENRALSLF
jgi:hypothetical protein